MHTTLRLALRVILALALLLAARRTSADEKKAPVKKKTSADVVKVVVTADKPDADGKQTVTISLTPDKPWRIYANPNGFKDKELAQAATAVTIAAKSKPKVIKIDFPTGKLIKDKDIGDYRVYADKVEIKAQVRRAKGDAEKLEVSVYFIAENYNAKSCLLPANVKSTIP
jgi:hypothetical protein